MGNQKTISLFFILLLSIVVVAGVYAETAPGDGGGVLAAYPLIEMTEAHCKDTAISVTIKNAGTCTGVTPYTGCTYGNYTVYPVQGGSSFVSLRIKDAGGNTVDTLLVTGWSEGRYVTKTSSVASLDITVFSITALQDGTVVGIDMAVGSIGTTANPLNISSLSFYVNSVEDTSPSCDKTSLGPGQSTTCDGFEGKEGTNLVQVIGPGNTVQGSVYCSGIENKTCTDSDGGKNIYVAGRAQGSDGKGTFDACTFLTDPKGILREAVCINGSAAHIEITCPAEAPYCNRAVCSNILPKCEDTDGGIKPDIRGTITEPRLAEGPTYTDYCQNMDTKQPWDDCKGELCGVREYYCTYPYRTTTYRDMKCSYGCKDGACLPIIEPIQIAYLNKPFTLGEGEKAEVVDYKNMLITLDGVAIGTGGESVILSIGMPTGDGTVGTRVVIDEGESKEIFGAIITVLEADFDTRTAKLLITLKGIEFELSIKMEKYTYSPGDIVKIIITLSGDPSLDFSKVVLDIQVIGPDNVFHPLEVSRIGSVVSECIQAETTGTYTCPAIHEYSFIAKYPLPSDALTGVYAVEVKARLDNIEKGASTRFEVRKVYSDYVDVFIKPREQYTVIGRPVTYYVTINDKHPVPVCIATETGIVGSCAHPVYSYMIYVYGLPYHSVYPSIVSISAGTSKTFELTIFPSPTRTTMGVAAAVQQTATIAITEIEEERIVTVPTGGVTEVGADAPSPIPEEQTEAMFRFTVQAVLKGDPTVRDTTGALLYVRYIETPTPPPFPEPEILEIKIRKGWNLISVPGKGSGFSRGTCSATQKPIAFIYLQDEKRYVSFEEALRAMGNERLLEYLSTHSFWIYSYEDCEIGFRVESYSTYSGLSLVQGWNLLGIAKDMVGETLSNIKGTCEFEKIYTWDTDLQKWAENSENGLIEEMGYGIAVKTTSACRLKQNVIQPPPLPGG